MAQTMVGRNTAEKTSYAKETLVVAYRHMLLARVLDDKLASLYRMGKIHGGVFLGRGQEALSASVGISLRPGDVFAPLIRDAAGRLAFGEALLDSVRTYLGSRLGPMRGRDGNIHRGRPREGLLPMISHLGAMISVVNGVLLGHRFKGIQGRVGASCMGDGASSTGSFHEALNQAAVERLPLVLVIANNQYAYSTPNERQFACQSLADKAQGYGVPAQSVDGTDLAACLQVVGHAVEQARQGAGPQMVVANLLRLCGHGEHDDANYVDPALRTTQAGRDCIEVAESQIVSNGIATEADLDQWRAAAVALVEQTVARVQREPAPDAREEDWRALSTQHLCEGQQT